MPLEFLVSALVTLVVVVDPEDYPRVLGVLKEGNGVVPEGLRREVRKTIIHEVAHHFGIDDAELERLGG